MFEMKQIMDHASQPVLMKSECGDSRADAIAVCFHSVSLRRMNGKKELGEKLSQPCTNQHCICTHQLFYFGLEPFYQLVACYLFGKTMIQVDENTPRRIKSRLRDC